MDAGGGVAAGAGTDTGSWVTDQGEYYVPGMSTERDVGLGDTRLYCRLMMLGSVRWLPWGSKVEAKNTIILALRW